MQWKSSEIKLRECVKANRFPLAELPSPLHELKRLPGVLHCQARVFIKRDDSISFAFGGTKIRKLEMIAAEAISTGADTLVTMGGIQSNCARATAAVAAKLGLNCVLILNGEQPERASGNLLLCELLGADIRYVREREDRESAAQAVLEELYSRGRKPLLVPISAATHFGALAVANAIFEILDKGLKPSAVFVCSSSGATQAGLILGCALRGLHTRIIGISPDDRASEIQPRVERFLEEMADKLLIKTDLTHDIEINDAYAGTVPLGRTTGGDAAVRLFAQTESIFLDPYYTSKPAAALIDALALNRLTAPEPIILWHTGGQSGLFNL